MTALTELFVVLRPADGKIVRYTKFAERVPGYYRPDGWYASVELGRDAFATEQDARDFIERNRVKRLVSLEKSIVKAQNLKVRVVDA